MVWQPSARRDESSPNGFCHLFPRSESTRSRRARPRPRSSPVFHRPPFHQPTEALHPQNPARTGASNTPSRESPAATGIDAPSAVRTLRCLIRWSHRTGKTGPCGKYLPMVGSVEVGSHLVIPGIPYQVHTQKVFGPSWHPPQSHFLRRYDWSPYGHSDSKIFQIFHDISRYQGRSVE